MAHIGTLIGLNVFVEKFRTQKPQMRFRRLAWRRRFRPARTVASIDSPTVAEQSRVREDAVALACLCIDRLASASLRAATTGRDIVVTVPDAKSAAILSDALRRTAETRPTDRLIRLRIEPPGER